MADYKIVDAEKLDADLTSVANAIRRRSGTAAKMVFPSGFNEAVESIPSGGSELPELTNPGTASDVASGKELIDANGNIVTGTLKDGGKLELLDGALGIFTSMKPNGTTVRGIEAVASADTDRIIRAGDKVGVVTAWDKFGDAKPEDVAKGKTFTSAHGITVEGIRDIDGGVTLPTLTNPASATDLALDKQLIDADGNVVNGTLGEATEGLLFQSTGEENTEMYGKAGDTNFSVVGVYYRSAIGDNTKGAIVRPGARVAVRSVPTSLFGDATAADVAAGKTFTSAAGLLVTGTASGGTGGGFTVTDDGEGNVTITSSAITDNSGDVVIG